MEDLRNLTIVIIMAPLLGVVIAGLLGRYIGRKATSIITCSLVGVSFLVSTYLLIGFFNQTFVPWDGSLYTWATIGTLNLEIGCLVDQLSVLMITVVSCISLLVHIYSIGYMQDDPGYHRFFAYISLFTFAMLTLVLANNFLQLFFGWEAVGLLSYLLIGFWYQKQTANSASLKAFIINRIGDVGFVIGIAAVFIYCGSLQYGSVFAQIPDLAVQQPIIDLICSCLFIGAMAKSAQIPLHVWLPDSMEGPTPISALIHAATMVTAGVYMVARMSPIFEYSTTTLSFITVIGAATAVLMGLVAIVQSDIKRIIAYSTISQLGIMVVALGVSAYAASIFHLVTHAFFKALLFLAAGSVITALHHEQDIFKMGNLRKSLPITFATMLIASLALIGLPGMSGFYSKDLIIDLAAKSELAVAPFVYYALLCSVFITALYSFRLLFIVFFKTEFTISSSNNTVTEPSRYIWIPLVILAVPSVLVGGLLIDFVLHNFFNGAIFVLPEHNTMTEFVQHDYHGAIEMLMHGLVSAPFFLVMLGALSAWLCYVKYPRMPVILQQKMHPIYAALSNKYGFDIINERLIVPTTKKISLLLWKVGDVICIDGILVNGSALGVGLIAGRLRKLQSGYLYQYAFVMISGLVLLLWWIFFMVSA